jgi:predicted membrane chloride channel (bestrophin family)
MDFKTKVAVIKFVVCLILVVLLIQNKDFIASIISHTIEYTMMDLQATALGQTYEIPTPTTKDEEIANKISVFILGSLEKNADNITESVTDRMQESSDEMMSGLTINLEDYIQTQ